MVEELISLLTLSQKPSGYYLTPSTTFKQLKTVHPKASFKHSITHSFIDLSTAHTAKSATVT